MKFKLYLSTLAVAVLAACAQPDIPQQAGWPEAENTGDFTADGRLAVKVEGKGSYANFDWAYQNQVQTINVNTPLGNTVGQLCQDRQGVLAVDSKGQVYRAQTAGQLSQQLLGFELPVQYLHIWANGKRVADAPYQLLSDGRLQQFDWVVSRTVNQAGQPRILLLENAKLSVRLVFDEMDTNPEASVQQQCAARG
ncbi:outer membrane lipoprotein LolB [Neisseria sp. CCUG12390]|uniref:outer membrane lipoprotein LolB n=1 Tax=Neisseria sp. CCUG12390 TaxID=3392035 RepID=UPI003A102C1D